MAAVRLVSGRCCRYGAVLLALEVVGGRRDSGRPTAWLGTLLDSLALVARSSMSLFAAPSDGLSATGTVVLVGERFVAISLLARPVAALRSRAHR